MEKSLSERSQAFANEYVSTSATWRDVRDALGPNEAAVEFIRAPFEEDDGSRAIYYAALVVTPTTEETPALALLTDGERLEKVDVRRYRASIRNQLGEEDQAYRAFWEPVAPLLGDATRAYVSLDGVYNQISLPTLKNPKTGAYLVDELETAIVSNTKSIVERRQPATVERRAVLVGYPDYDFAGGGGGVQGATGGTERALDGETRSSLRGVNLAPLEGTKAETAAIEELMRANGWEARALLGAVATETAVKSVDRPRALHIATHGFFCEGRRAHDRGRRVRRWRRRRRRSVRCSARGCSSRAPRRLNSEATFPTNDNGVLTAYEAMNMNLDGAELVALSACETGLGDVKNGEGVYGLQRAFQTAGAQSVLMSLWKVDDDATRLLMTEFYRRWLGGASKREALDAARTATRERYPEPLYWGAFTLVGG